MSKSNSFETELLLHIFNNLDIANIGDAAGLQNSAADGSLYVALHTADPGEAGTQATSEATYTGYARVGVARTAGGWTVAGNNASNTAQVTFGVCTAGVETLTYFSIGKSSAGATGILYSGQITSPVGGLPVSPGITPIFAAGEIDTSED